MIHRLIATFREAYGGVPKNVWLISLVLLVSRCGTMVLPFLSLYFANELGFAPAEIGWLLGIYGVGGIAAGLIGGQLTQRIGAIPTQVLSLTLAVPGFLILGQVQDYYSAAASLLYLSIAAESMRPASVTATIEFCDSVDQHTKAMAVNRLAVNLGMTAGPLIGGFLATVDFSLLFYVNAAGSLVAMFCMLYFFGLRRRPVTQNKPKAKAGVLSPWRDSFFITFAVLNMLGATVFFQLMGTFPLYLKEFYYFQEYHIGLLFAVNTVVIVLFELLLVNYVKRFSLLGVIAWGQLLSCVGFGILPLAVGSSFGVGFAFCVVTVLVWTVGEMLAMPLGAAFAAQCATDENRGSYMGLYVASFSVAAVIGPVVGMWIFGWNPHALWYLALVLGGLVFGGILLLNRRMNRRR